MPIHSPPSRDWTRKRLPTLLELTALQVYRLVTDKPARPPTAGLRASPPLRRQRSGTQRTGACADCKALTSLPGLTVTGQSARTRSAAVSRRFQAAADAR